MLHRQVWDQWETQGAGRTPQLHFLCHFAGWASPCWVLTPNLVLGSMSKCCSCSSLLSLLLQVEQTPAGSGVEARLSPGCLLDHCADQQTLDHCSNL